MLLTCKSNPHPLNTYWKIINEKTKQTKVQLSLKGDNIKNRASGNSQHQNQLCLWKNLLLTNIWGVKWHTLMVFSKQIEPLKETDIIKCWHIYSQVCISNYSISKLTLSYCNSLLLYISHFVKPAKGLSALDFEENIVCVVSISSLTDD